MHLTAIKVRRTCRSLSRHFRSRQVYQPRRRAHGQYHLRHRQSARDDRTRAAARHRDQSRRPWPREGDGRTALTVRSPACRAKRGSGGERCSQDSQNPDSYSGSQGSGLLSPSASRQRRNLPAGPPIATTTFRVFAARRTGAGLRPRRSPVIGLIAAAGWNADGRRSPMAMRPAAGSVKAVRRAGRPACRKLAPVIGFHKTVFELSYRDRCRTVRRNVRQRPTANPQPIYSTSCVARASRGDAI
jgi:hypothetical protein